MKKENLEDSLDDLQVCTTMDMTGLIPAGNVSEEDLEDYKELYPFLPQPLVKKDGEKTEG